MIYAYMAGLPAELHSSWAASWYANTVILRRSRDWPML